MINQRPPSPESARAGYEVRDLSIPLIVTAGLVVALSVAAVAIGLWQVSVFAVPEQQVPGTSPPTLMPNEEPVSDRLKEIPSPRLDPLEELEAKPASYRSSRPLPGTVHTQKPWDLHANRQPELNNYGWVEKEKVARIPIDQAMNLVVEREQAKAKEKKAEGKKGGGK